MARIVHPNRRATNSQITVVCRTASRNVQLVDPCHGWAIAADSRIVYYIYFSNDINIGVHIAGVCMVYEVYLGYNLFLLRVLVFPVGKG